MYAEWLEKVEEIEGYFKSLFPEYTVQRVADSLRTQLFQKFLFEVKGDTGEVRHRLSMDYGFVHHNSPQEAAALFEKRNLRRIMEDAGQSEVVVTDDGIRVVKVGAGSG